MATLLMRVMPCGYFSLSNANETYEYTNAFSDSAVAWLLPSYSSGTIYMGAMVLYAPFFWFYRPSRNL